MKNLINKSIYVAFGLLSVLSACKKDFQDPSKAKTEVALGSGQALTAVAVGIQRAYTTTRTGVIFNAIATSGFSSDELRLLNAGNIPELQLSTGGNAVDGTNTILFNLWATAFKVIDESDKVIANAEKLSDKPFAASLIGQVTIFKALSLGTISSFWEKVPTATGKNVPFVDRMDGYKAAIAAIDKALALNPAPLSGAPNLNITNTLHALKARYALFSKQYGLALTEANLVVIPPTVALASNFAFETANINVLYSIISSNNVFQPLNANLGLPASLTPDPADKRLSFYTEMAGAPTPTIRMKGFAATTTTSIPIFLPGEIALIKAEAYARQATPDLVNALLELNNVVQKVTDVYGIGANLPPLVGPFTQSQLLEQIYKHRCIELYASGMKLEDMRRFERPIAERKRNFMPYPFQERDNNTNTPPNPTF